MLLTVGALVDGGSWRTGGGQIADGFPYPEFLLKPYCAREYRRFDVIDSIQQIKLISHQGSSCNRSIGMNVKG